MSGKLRVPERYAPPLAEFVKLSPQKLASFLEALKEDGSPIGLSGLARLIASRLELDVAKAREIVRLLASLYMAREDGGEELSDFVAELRSAMETSGKVELQPLDWDAYQSAIMGALSGDNALAIAAKAEGVASDHDKLYCYARILTDLRPIFRSDVEQAPAAFVAIHTLKIAYHEDEEHREWFVAMDREDIEQLISTLQRALKKDGSLRRFASEKRIEIRS